MKDYKLYSEQEIVTEYEYLSNKKKEIERRLDLLKKVAQKVNQKKFLIYKTGYTFTSKFQTYKKVPMEFLQLNQRELSALYRSAAGGKRVLTEYGLNVRERNTLNWRGRVVQEAQKEVKANGMDYRKIN